MKYFINESEFRRLHKDIGSIVPWDELVEYFNVTHKDLENFLGKNTINVLESKIESGKLTFHDKELLYYIVDYLSDSILAKMYNDEKFVHKYKDICPYITHSKIAVLYESKQSEKRIKRWVIQNEDKVEYIPLTQIKTFLKELTS